MSLFTPHTGVTPMQSRARMASKTGYRWIFIVQYLRCEEYVARPGQRTKQSCSAGISRLGGHVFRLPACEGGTPSKQPARRQRYKLFSVDEMTTPVLLPALLGRFRAERLFLAVADRLHVIGSNAPLHQGITDRIRAAIAQGQIVFRRSPFVAVT